MPELRNALDRLSDSVFGVSGLQQLMIEEATLPAACQALMPEILYLLPRLTWWLADGTFVLHESTTTSSATAASASTPTECSPE